MLPQTMANYQILIVGGGLAGLHTALRTSERYPNLQIAVAELYPGLGGRVQTYYPKEFPGIHWENGAGRYHKSHRLVRHYIQKYGLTEIPINPKQVYRENSIDYPDTWPTISDVLASTLGQLSEKNLAIHTVKELLKKFKLDDYLHHFAYRAEADTLRADLALKAFTHEMNSSADFFVVAEGFSTLIKRMREELEGRGVTFLFNHRLSAVEPHTTPILCKFVVKRKHATITADKVILAVQSEALKGISPFQNLPVLKHLAMKPLLRTYGIFPTKNKVPWFDHIPKTVARSPLRYIIPINPEKGVIMTSYTDSEDTSHWRTKTAEKDIMKELRKEFPGREIPDPLFFKEHWWKEGCTYWLPGLYDPQEESDKVMCPQPGKWQNLFVCGESYSMRQAWMEGALEHSESMLKRHLL